MAGDLSGVQQLLHATGYAVQAVWTGAGAAGTLKLQTSNDNITYDDLTGSSTVVAGAGSYVWNVWTCNYNYVKCVFTHSGGSAGEIYVTVNYKGF